MAAPGHQCLQVKMFRELSLFQPRTLEATWGHSRWRPHCSLSCPLQQEPVTPLLSSPLCHLLCLMSCPLCSLSCILLAPCPSFTPPASNLGFELPSPVCCPRCSFSFLPLGGTKLAEEDYAQELPETTMYIGTTTNRHSLCNSYSWSYSTT